MGNNITSLKSGVVDSTHLKVPEAEKLEEVPMQIDQTMTEATPEVGHKHNYVPLWMSGIVFLLIVVAYTYCYANGYAVNEPRMYSVLAISGTITAICAYLQFK